jgi:hypothetical protein
MLIDAAEDRGPMLFVKMGIHRAVERLVAQGFNQSWQPYTNVTARLKATSNKVVEE